VNDIRCALHTLQDPKRRVPAPFILFGMSLCGMHLLRAAALVEGGASTADVLAAARRGEL
jgi:hypothetical protein